MTNFGKSIRIFLIEGDPEKRWVCELSNWTGVAYKIPRSLVRNCTDRPELNGPGVYFLLGRNDLDYSGQVYIGEGENINQRLGQHFVNKNEDRGFWTECIVFISKGDYLNKAHVKYLESRLYKLVKDANRYELVNGNTPPLPALSEADRAELEEFIQNIRLIINTLGHRLLDPVIPRDREENNQSYYYIKTGKGADAKGRPVTDGFAVVKGSAIVSSTAPSMSINLLALRNRLINQGKINSEFVFTEDYEFTSPSLAAAVILGRNANGLTEWKNEGGKTLKEIESAGIAM